MMEQRERCEEKKHPEPSGEADRRNFMRQLAAAMGGLAAVLMAEAATAAPSVGPVGVVVPIPGVPWRQRIYCQFDPQNYKELHRALRQCAEETGCDIVFGEKDSPDLYAIGGFVLVLDRNEVGDEWLEYVEMYRYDADNTPCFIIDNRTDLPLPTWNFTYRFDMASPGSVATIAEAIRQMKLEMNRRLPELFKRPENSRPCSV